MIERNRAQLTRYYQAGLIVLLLLALMARAWIPGVNDFLCNSLVAFTILGQYAFESFTRPYGTQAVVVPPFLTILQAIIASLPAFVITFVSASLSGAFWGGVLPWSSAMIGTALCLFIVCILGHGVVEKLTGKMVLNNTDAFIERYGKHTTLVCCLLPFMLLDPVNCAAGLILIRFRHLLIATGIRQLPTVIIYSQAGSLPAGSTSWFVTGLLILFVLSVVISVARSPYLECQRKES